jgi:hypothetical protein
MKFQILFYEDGDPIDIRAIGLFVNSFSKSYTKTVQTIIRDSKVINEHSFKHNIALLMPSFKMTRNGVYRGLKVGKGDNIVDPNNITDVCWKEIGQRLIELKSEIPQEATRSRVIADLAPSDIENVTDKTNRLYESLSAKSTNGSTLGRVGATKILFSVFPEVALPIDTSQWRDVFKTSDYKSILKTMIGEIKDWEQRTEKKLEKCAVNKVTTLPSIYNVMAMIARPQI